MFSNHLFDNHLMKACLAALFAIGLTACSSSDDPAPVAMPDPGPTPQETCEVGGGQWADGMCLSAAEVAYNSALAAIAAAATAEDAQAAYDAVKDDVSATQGDALQMLVDARIAALATMAREADQKMALADAAGMIDTSDLSTQALVDTANEAIRGLRQALENAADVSDADKAMYQMQLTAAVNAVDMAQGGIDTETRRTNQMAALSSASMALHPALTALAGSTPTEAQLKAAQEALAALNQAIMDAADLTDAEKAPYVSEAAIATGPIQMAQDAYDEEAEAKRKEMEAEARAKAQAAANKIALTKKAAIAAELNLQNDGETTPPANRPFDGANAYDTADDADNTATNYQVTVKHTDGAVDVMVVDGHGDYDAKNDPKFGMAASFGNGQMLVRNDGTAREIIVLHTDIEAPEMVRFGTSMSGYNLTVDIDTDTSANDSYLVSADDASKLGGSRIVSDDTGSKTLSLWEAEGDNAGNVFAGTLDGAAGKFRCQTESTTGEGCSINTANDDDNTVTIGTGDVLWFTPDAGATVSIADDDYLSYGFWLDTTTKDGDIASYDAVQTFATSSLAASTGLSNVRGTAKYEGGAAGVYVHETKKDDGTLDAATSGRFTADVALTAHFDSSANRLAGTLEGTISDFELDGGPENSWKVNVMASGLGTDEVFNGNASGMEGNNGSLTGQFHGTGDADDNTVAPPVLVGEFNSTFVNGTVAGAYGARKE